MSAVEPKRIAIIGTAGVPANYGGFETLADNLVVYHEETGASEALTVYCSTLNYTARPERYRTADLRYIPLNANGAPSMPYDWWSMLSAVWRGCDTLLVLGVSGTTLLPLIRLISRARIVTNIDGIEWRRDKWGVLQSWILKRSEAMAVRLSHEVIADNQAIADYVTETYRKACSVIAYGGDHATQVEAVPVDELQLPERYALTICRIEPENNVHMILEAFSSGTNLPLVCVGNWDHSAYGADLKRRYADHANISVVDPIYDTGKLKTLRSGASAYVHGHSAGGTNPSLVEIMHFGIPVFAFDCSFNRNTTDDRAAYFADAPGLHDQINGLGEDEGARNGTAMRDIATERYTWHAVGSAYFDLLRRSSGASR